MQNVTRAAPLNTVITPAFGSLSAAGTTNIIVPPTSTAKIRVLAFYVSADAATSVRFLSNASGISGFIYLGAGEGLTTSFNEHGWFTTNPGETLVYSSSAAAKTDAHVIYQIIP